MKPRLLTPGPTPVPEETLLELAKPVTFHRSPDFRAGLAEVVEDLKYVFQTKNTVLVLTASGTGGMEAAVSGVVAPGEKAILLISGRWGERWRGICKAFGVNIVPVEVPYGEAVRPEQLEKALAQHPDTVAVFATFSETSTGVRNDVEPLGDRKGDALLLLDCVTSLGGIPVDIDGWGVDIAYSGTQKCLGVPPGLAPLTMNQRAIDRFVERSQSWYLDLRMIAKYALDSGSGRTYHHTAPTAMIAALNAGLGALLDEGLEASWARHAECGRMLHGGLEKLGFRLFAEDGHRLPELTTAWVPEDVADEAAVRRTLLDRYDIEIGGGLGAYAGKVWRIGCMGHTARPRNVTLLLGALAEVLSP